MSYLTYIASDSVFPESEYLWPLYQGASDLYTEKSCIAEVIPDLRNFEWIHPLSEDAAGGDRSLANLAGNRV